MTRPHDPGGGGGFKYPVPQNSMMTRGDVRKNINNDRYGGPVQTPSRGTGGFKREDVEMKQRLRMTAAVGLTPSVGRYVRQTGIRQEIETDVLTQCGYPLRELR